MQSRWHTLQVTAGSLLALALPLASQLKAQEPPKPVAQVTIVKIREDDDAVKEGQPQRKLKPQPVRLQAVQKSKVETGEGEIKEKKVQLRWHVQGKGSAVQLPTHPQVKVMAKALFVDEDGNVTELGHDARPAPGAVPPVQLQTPQEDRPHVIMLQLNDGIAGLRQIIDLHEHEIDAHDPHEDNAGHPAPSIETKTIVRPRRFRRAPRRMTRTPQVHEAHPAPHADPKVIEYELEIEKEAGGGENQIRLHIEGAGDHPQVLKLQPGAPIDQGQIFRIEANPEIRVERATPAHPAHKILIHNEEQGGQVEVEVIELGEAGSADDVIMLKGAQPEVKKVQRIVERIQDQAADRVLRHEMIEIVGAPDDLHAAPAELKQMLEKLHARIAELEKKVAELEQQE